MFKLTLKKINSSRRSSTTAQLDKRDIVNHIRGGIYLYQLEGKSYFTQTMIKIYLNQQIGWPCLNNPASLRKFNNLFKPVADEYMISNLVKGAYSFQLKPNSKFSFLDKILQSSY